MSAIFLRRNPDQGADAEKATSFCADGPRAHGSGTGSVPVKVLHQSSWSLARRQRLYGYLLIAPAVLYLSAVIGVPMLVSLFTSFRQWNLTNPAAGNTFVGLANYVDLIANPQMRHSLAVTVTYVVLAVALEIVLGFALALLLNTKLRGINLFRTLVLLPMMVSDVASSLSWRLLFDAQTGLLNYLLIRVGLGPQLWLGPSLALVSVVIVDVWQNTPFVVLILLAGLQGLSVELLEAAKIDGASVWQELSYIVLPFLRPAFLVAITFRCIFALRVFAPVWVLTGGGPADQTLTMGLVIYRQAFRYYDIGVSAAVSWSLVLLTVGLALVFTRFLTREAMP